MLASRPVFATLVVSRVGMAWLQSPGVTPSPVVDGSPPPIRTSEQLYAAVGWSRPSEQRIAHMLCTLLWASSGFVDTVLLVVQSDAASSAWLPFSDFPYHAQNLLPTQWGPPTPPRRILPSLLAPVFLCMRCFYWHALVTVRPWVHASPAASGGGGLTTGAAVFDSGELPPALSPARWASCTQLAAASLPHPCCSRITHPIGCLDHADDEASEDGDVSMDGSGASLSAARCVVCVLCGPTRGSSRCRLAPPVPFPCSHARLTHDRVR